MRIYGDGAGMAGITVWDLKYKVLAVKTLKELKKVIVLIDVFNIKWAKFKVGSIFY